MKKQFLFLIILALLLTVTSCVTKRRCASKFPPESSVNIHDSVVYSTFYRYRDTVISQIVEVPNFSTKDSTVIRYVNNTANVSPLFLKGNFSEASAWLYNGYLMGTLNEGGFMNARVKLAMQDKYIRELKQNTKTTKEIQKVKYVPKIVEILAYVGGFSLLLILLYIAWRIAKMYFKISIVPVSKIIP